MLVWNLWIKSTIKFEGNSYGCLYITGLIDARQMGHVKMGHVKILYTVFITRLLEWSTPSSTLHIGPVISDNLRSRTQPSCSINRARQRFERNLPRISCMTKPLTGTNRRKYAITIIHPPNYNTAQSRKISPTSSRINDGTSEWIPATWSATQH
jgi:hypothetical protein